MKKLVIVMMLLSASLHAKVDPINHYIGVKFYLNDIDFEIKLYDKISLEIGGSYYPNLYRYLSDDSYGNTAMRLHTAVNLYSFEGMGSGWFLKPFYDYYNIFTQSKTFYRYGLGIGYNYILADYFTITADAGYGISFGNYIDYLEANNKSLNHINLIGNVRVGFVF